MKIKILLTLLSLFGIALCGLSAYVGQNIPFAEQWPLFEALRTTSSIIFAVVGAWLAIVYPERMKLSFGRPAGIDRNSTNVGLLLYPAGCSTIILICVLFAGILAPIIKHIPQAMQHLAYLRGFSFFILTFLTLWQITVVVITLYPADLVKTSADVENAASDFRSSRSSLVQRSDED